MVEPYPGSKPLCPKCGSSVLRYDVLVDGEGDPEYTWCQFCGHNWPAGEVYIRPVVPVEHIVVTLVLTDAEIEELDVDS